MGMMVVCGMIHNSVQCVCVCEPNVFIPLLFYPFFLAPGSDVKNKGLSVYEFLYYEYLLSSLALHY